MAISSCSSPLIFLCHLGVLSKQIEVICRCNPFDCSCSVLGGDDDGKTGKHVVFLEMTANLIDDLCRVIDFFQRSLIGDSCQVQELSIFELLFSDTAFLEFIFLVHWHTDIVPCFFSNDYSAERFGYLSSALYGEGDSPNRYVC